MRSVVRSNLAVGNAPDRELDELALRAAVTGDRTAARQLVECYQHRVFALVSRLLAGRGRAVSEDVAQDTFLHVFRRLPTFDFGGAAKLSTWILTIAARRAIDELRRRRPAPVADLELLDERVDGRGDERAMQHQMLAAIEAALSELSPELRGAFVLREYHGLEYTEIAAALAIDLGTVKSRLSRARAALRARLTSLHDVNEPPTTDATRRKLR